MRTPQPSLLVCEEKGILGIETGLLNGIDVFQAPGTAVHSSNSFPFILKLISAAIVVVYT